MIYGYTLKRKQIYRCDRKRLLSVYLNTKYSIFYCTLIFVPTWMNTCDFSINVISIAAFILVKWLDGWVTVISNYNKALIHTVKKKSTIENNWFYSFKTVCSDFFDKTNVACPARTDTACVWRRGLPRTRALKSWSYTSSRRGSWTPISCIVKVTKPTSQFSLHTSCSRNLTRKSLK